MAFPTSPINGQETTINGITYTFSSSNNAWTRKPRQLFTAGVNAPANPAPGDQWYDTSEDILYQYINDGSSNYWVDIRSGIFGGNSASLGETQIAGNLIPTTNITYTLGNTTHRFKDLWLAGNTIYLGGATISTSGSNVAITNPAGGSFSVTGSVAGSANVSFGNVFANYFFANGAAFTSSNYGNTEVAAYLVANPQGSTYSNTNVAAYLRSTNGLGSATEGIVLPSGTTAQRPATAANGTMRYNSSTNLIEAFFGNVWVSLAQASYIASYLVVAGGGGGGVQVGGGGGGGGVLSGTLSVFSGQSYSIVVGAGGTGSSSSSLPGSKGANSTVGGSTIVAQGGGGGGSYAANNGATTGGSGGGAGAGTGGTTTGASGVVGQGYAGGSSVQNGWSGGGGGGGGGAGGNASGQIGGNGGIGFMSNITGSVQYYGGGGGGCSDTAQATLASGGQGGGGGGWSTNYHPGANNNGTDNTGGGGGGQRDYPSTNGPGANGGSGIVIISYPGLPRTNSGIVTQGNGYTIHTFTSSGTFVA